MMEEDVFNGRTADYIFMLLFGISAMTVCFFFVKQICDPCLIDCCLFPGYLPRQFLSSLIPYLRLV